MNKDVKLVGIFLNYLEFGHLLIFWRILTNNPGFLYYYQILEQYLQTPIDYI